MALFLLIETATDICSIGISDGTRLLALRESDAFHEHAARITGMIVACAEEAKVPLSALDAVAVSTGPGSYTGLRIGVSTAKGICYALQKPLIAVDTLQALALATAHVEKRPALYCPMIDARRMEVYAAIFDADNRLIQPAAALRVEENTFADYFAQEQAIVFSGSGAEKCKTVLHSPLAHFSPVVCSAAHLVPLATAAFATKMFADVAYFEPFYLKPPNITTPKKGLW